MYSYSKSVRVHHRILIFLFPSWRGGKAAIKYKLPQINHGKTLKFSGIFSFRPKLEDFLMHYFVFTYVRAVSQLRLHTKWYNCTISTKNVAFWKAAFIVVYVPTVRYKKSSFHKKDLAFKLVNLSSLINQFFNLYLRDVEILSCW